MRAARWLLALSVAWADGAAGHASLVASVPADGAALQVPPARIELRFSEPATPVVVRFFAGSAAAVVLPAPQVASEVLELALPANLGDGLYTVSYRVISADSHPVGGSIVFGIGERSPPPPAASSITDGPSASMTVLRAVRDLALLIAAGGAIFILCVTPFRMQRAILGTCGAVAVVAALAGIGLHGAEMLDDRIWSPAVWRIGLLSSYGLSASGTALGASLIVIGTMLSARRAGLVFLVIGALAAIASLPLTGHARTTLPVPLAVAALAAHALAAAFWTGSLVALLAIMSVRESSDTAVVAALKRFSRWGMGAVGLLLLAGIAFAALQLGSLPELYASRYGLLIVAKLALLLALLLLAALNRFRWLPLLERGARAAGRRLRGSVAGEAALVVCVIGVTAVLVHTPPPRTQAAPGFAQKLAHKNDIAEIAVRPARAGANTIRVRFRDNDGLPFDPEEVLIEIGNEAAGIEAAARPMRRLGPGDYSREGSELAYPGLWTIEVRARIDDDMASFRSRVPIR